MKGQKSPTNEIQKVSIKNKSVISEQYQEHEYPKFDTEFFTGLSKRWKFEKFKDTPVLKDAIFIEGLPGIGNVGKIVVDFMIDELKAVKIYEIFGHSMPNSVFVNEQNLAELPKIELFYKRIKNKDLIFLTGDVQPIDEESCYDFCEDLIIFSKKYNVKEIITLGGIGLGEMPRHIKVYCTGNNKELIKKYKEGTNIHTKLYGIVGPIVGVTGLLLGIAEKRNVPAIALLSETLGHPMYLGVKAAKETLNVLNIKLGLSLDTKKIDKEITQLDKAIKRAEESQPSEFKKGKTHNMASQPTSYIG